tara:strand:+ start:494 stop:3376 length:2883 start_codon:yes stop_codon:yes gene_type:complete
MAIIYTYPLKHKPVPADLVVITDSQDRNYTKQCSIQSIIDIIPGGGGGGCPTTYVIKPIASCSSTEPRCIVSKVYQDWIYTCDATLGAIAPGFIESLVINGEAIDNPSGQTCWYIEELDITADATTCCCPEDILIYTFTPCDTETGTEFSTSAPFITGLDLAWVDNACAFLEMSSSFGDGDCWQVTSGGLYGEQAATINSAELLSDPCTCECCLYPCTFKYDPCPGAPDPSINKIYVNGWEYGCDITSMPTQITYEYSTGLFWCYHLSEKECVAPNVESFGTSGFDGPCNHPDICPSGEELNYEWRNCNEPFNIVAVASSPGPIPIGTTRRYCCDTGETYVPECWEYLGEVYTPESGSLPSCPLVGETTEDPSCECCNNTCNILYDACEGKPGSHPDNVVVARLFDNATCLCDDAVGGIVIEIEGITWCYENPFSTCDPVTHVPFVSDVSCGDEVYCPAPLSQYRWKLCGEEEYSYTDSASDPFITTIGSFPFIGTLQTAADCDTEMCCVEIEEFVHSSAITPIGSICTVSALEEYIDCNCCMNRNVAKYQACASGGEDCGIHGPYYIDTCDEWGVLITDASVPDFLQFEVIPEEYCCFERVDNDTCEPAAEVPDYNSDPSFIDCDCGVATTYKWTDCAGVVADVIEAVDPGVAIGFTKRLCCDGEPSIEYCFEYIGPVSEPISGSYPECDLQGDSYDDCACCLNHCNFEYTACEPVPPAFPEKLIINMGLEDFGCECNEAPTGIVIEIEGETWCYGDPESTCEEISGYEVLETGVECEDPIYCPTPPSELIELTSCDGAYIETVDPVDLTPDPSALTDVDVINTTAGILAGIATCWRITNISAPGPVTQVGNTDWNGPIAPGSVLDECECCEQDLRQYNICDGAAGVTCNALAVPLLLIDVALVPGWGPVTHQVVVGQETGTGIQCCYVLNEEIPDCEAPDGTIISPVPTCEDDDCNLI